MPFSTETVHVQVGEVALEADAIIALEGLHKDDQDLVAHLRGFSFEMLHELFNEGMQRNTELVQLIDCVEDESKRRSHQTYSVYDEDDTEYLEYDDFVEYLDELDPDDRQDVLFNQLELLPNELLLWLHNYVITERRNVCDYLFIIQAAQEAK